MSTKEDNEEIGYRKPPRQNQFKKGRSGNPRGRSKGSGSLSSLMEKILNEPMRLKIDRRQIVVTGRHALGLVMVDRAVRGDVRMIQLLQKYGCFERSDEPRIMWMAESLKDL